MIHVDDLAMKIDENSVFHSSVSQRVADIV